MRFILPAVLAFSLLSGAACAAEDDEILSDLVVVTATPRSADVKMVVQTAKPPPEKQAKAKEGAAQPVKIASK